MGRLAFVFSGQGDQFPGMGKELYEEYGAAKDIFYICDMMRPGTSEQCFYGSKEILTDTANTQPCLFAVEMAAASVLREHRIFPDAAAGFSLGEVAACTFAGVFSIRQGFSLIMKRAQLMKEAADKQPSFMAAVLRLDEDVLKKICERVGDIYPVNYNCPGQITVSGREDRKERFSEEVNEAGGRLIPLKVSGAFHSPFMKTAAERFRNRLDEVIVREPEIPVYSNVTALPYEEDIRESLARQIMSPVLWEKTVRNMIEDGIDTFMEIGPGKTLSGVIRRIDRNVRVYDLSDLPKMIQEVKAC